MKTYKFRRKVDFSDLNTVDEIVTSTGFFNKEEISFAVEMVDDKLNNGELSSYEFIFLDDVNGNTHAYTCHGKIPGTKNSYALYWIVVHENHRNCGLGKVLLKETEKDIFKAGGNAIYVETSSRKQYDPTRKFYLNNDYIQKAVFEDYYDLNDDLVFFVKKF